MTPKQQAFFVLAVGLLGLVYFHTRIYNGLAGPFDVEVRDLVLLEEVPTKEWVRIVRDGHPMKYSELEQAPFVEMEVPDQGKERRAASFRYLDEYKRRMLFRVTDETDSEIVGVLTPLSNGVVKLAEQVPGEVLFVDCENTNYRFVSLIALAASLLVTGVGLSMLRSAFRRRSS